MDPASVWKTLADKETASLRVLGESKSKLVEEKSRLEARLVDVDNYIAEYSSKLQAQSEFEFGIKQVYDRMNMISQLLTAKRDLEGFGGGVGDGAVGAAATGRENLDLGPGGARDAG